MLNVVALQGRLAADPQLRQTNSGKNVASFRIACDRGRKDANGQSVTDWIDCVAWERSADFVCKYFQKGSLIAVDGRLQTRQYTDKNGNNRTATEVLVQNINFCGGKGSADAPDIRPAAPVYSNPGNTIPFVQKPPVAANPAPVGEDDFQPVEGGEDLPF